MPTTEERIKELEAAMLAIGGFDEATADVLMIVLGLLDTEKKKIFLLSINDSIRTHKNIPNPVIRAARLRRLIDIKNTIEISIQ